MPTKDPAQRAAYNAAYYAANKDKWKLSPEQRKARRQRDARRVREFLIERKSQPCADCGVPYPPPVMEFDHVRGVKRFSLSVARCASRGFAAVRAEVAKCDVVCANCHRMRHIGNEWNGYISGRAA